MNAKFEEWGANKPIGPRMLAREAIADAHETHAFLDLLHTGKGLDRFPKIPPHNEWLPLYKKHRKVRASLVDGLDPAEPGEQPSSVAVGEMLDALRSVTPEKLPEIQKVIDAIGPDAVNELRREMAAAVQDSEKAQVESLSSSLSEQSDPVEDERFDATIRTHEGNFYVRVWLPCMFLGGKWPTVYFREARQGNINSLEFLLRIDKTIIQDPKIAAIIREAASSGNLPLLKRIGRAIGSLAPHISRKRFKVRAAAFASLAFKQTGGINAPELGNLFDLTAQKRTGGQSKIDKDIAAGETLSRAILRAHEDWKDLLPTPTKQKTDVSGRE